ncbi:hypothetical protein K9O30_00980 [Clostridium bowmanii]|uniref:hypothetical protein n=1 Tax=Clostridium bowmanii TaxID=132925 RepID=UPI001C0E08C7|nr:hypothetical protein [Clostridium bowmanii]MBU3188155.1 hypothetical protein [Clostridium bowmanii]MCA1072337.1 hypothetical protein [Clostridium bowmanii]
MESIIIPNYNNLEEIQFNIYDSEISYYGGSQNWFPKKFHNLSGCGPVAAANITAYLSQNFTDRYNTLYPYKGIISKKDFTMHMVEIRKYVKPGLFGLTSVDKFSDSVLAFSSDRGVSLSSHILADSATSIQDAINFIAQALSQKLPVAILVLKHSLKEFKEYTWHWMTITGLKLNLKDNLPYIIVSSYGGRQEINLDLLWNKRRSKDIIRLAYFN